MSRKVKRALIVPVSSDIGFGLAQRWGKRGLEIAGTYRRSSAKVGILKDSGVMTFRCEAGNAASVRRVCSRLRSAFGRWDYLVLGLGDLEPVGEFEGCDFSRWSKSLEVNFIRQMQFVRELLPSRNRKGNHPPVVLFFAGGGTNNATVNYSAYTVSKIALIKMCELLDKEVRDTNFAILGPGWVKTKIHQATLKAGAKAGANFQKTRDKLAGDECTPMETVLDSCDWIVSAPRKAVSGRNFSVVSDKWRSGALIKKLLKDPDMYKLRRHGNDWGKRP